MTVEHGNSGRDGEPAAARAADLVRDALRTLAEAERVLAQVQQSDAPRRAADLAARQAAIVDAAHEEAAVILAKAHADAARILEQAALGRPRAAVPAGPHDGGGAQAVVDLREGDDHSGTVPSGTAVRPSERSAPADPTAPAGPAVPLATDGPIPSGSAPAPADPVDADLRASIAAAADMARRVSGRIERLSQDLHQAPAS